MTKTPMTVHGAEALRVECEKLRTQDRPRVIGAIAEARAHGDLRENAEYHAAKEEQGLIEARIRDIEAKLANATIIDITKLPKQDKVIFGATICVVNTDTDETLEFQIVGVDEADIKQGKISLDSPLARAAIGKSVSDEIEVRTPNGVQAYEIVRIDYK